MGLASAQKGRRWRRALLALGLMGSLEAQAQLVVPAGSTIDLGGGSFALGCTDVTVGGTLVVGAGSALTEVRNFQILPGGSVQLGGGLIALAQTWDNQGLFDAGGGQVVRVASAACPAVGPLGSVLGGAPVGVSTPIPTLSEVALSLLAALLGSLGWRAQAHARTRRRADR